MPFSLSSVTVGAPGRTASTAFFLSPILLALAACGGGGEAADPDATATAATADSAASSGEVRILAASGSADAAWTTLATEGGSFTVSGTQTVRYGAGSAYLTRQISGSSACSNAAFGSDPAYGVVKQCQVAAPAVAWTRIADEGRTFSVSGTQTVRYGAGTAYVTRTVSGTGTCGNGYFGNDPAYGTVKHCDVAGTTPTPTPAPTPVAAAGVCTPPATAVDTSTAAATVGNGTPGSCTEAALRAAVAAQGVVKFNCGTAPATIAVRSQIDIPAGRNTVIDGGNRITLDGGGATRILNVAQNNYRTNRNGLTLQHITLKNGRAPGGNYVAPDPSKPQCAFGYGSGAGAAVLVQDARFHAFDVDFQNNAAATPGPDIGGGAVYAVGSLDVLISGSRFNGNSGANAGAVGMLNSDLRLYNSAFQGNTANGPGQTAPGSLASCPGVAYAGQGGGGGSGGAVGIDGGDDGDVTVCGSNFIGNHANGIAGALFRTPDRAARKMTIDRSVFQNNTARQAGAIYVMNSAPLDILGSTFSGNKAVLFGAAQLQGNQFTIVNSTFSGNEATTGVGGAIGFNSSWAGSMIQNSTFADNKASGGPGYFGAAIFGDTSFAVRNTVFSNNTSTDPYNPMQCGFSPNPGSNGLQWPQMRAVGGYTDTACVAGITFANPQLGALGNNGGPTPTQAPASTSPLKNAGRNCPPTDQRGNPRSASTCTVGAVE